MVIADVSAQFATISVNPTEYTVGEPGETFTIDVNITYVPPLRRYEFKLEFNNTLLNATGVTPGGVNPSGTTYGPGKLVDSIYVWTPLQNVSDGFVWVIANFSETFWGNNGTLMTINFIALEEGTCALHFYDTALIGPLNNTLFHLKVDGSITVIPEFPTAIFAPLLLIATLAAAFLGKMFWSRKRKCARQI